MTNETIEALRAQVETLTKERNELLWALQWSNSHASRVHYIGNSDEAHRMSDEQHANNQRVSALLDKYAATVWTATTAPDSERSA